MNVFPPLSKALVPVAPSSSDRLRTPAKELGYTVYRGAALFALTENIEKPTRKSKSNKDSRTFIRHADASAGVLISMTNAGQRPIQEITSIAIEAPFDDME